jgi:hypothetical protein
VARPKDPEPRYDPGVVRFLTRQIRHFIQVAVIIIVHLGIKLVAHFADQKYEWAQLEHAWWVIGLEDASAVFALVGFVCTTGFDVLAEIAESGRSAWGRIRGRREVLPDGTTSALPKRSGAPGRPSDRHQ